MNFLIWIGEIVGEWYLNYKTARKNTVWECNEKAPDENSKQNCVNTPRLVHDFLGS